jgi:nuclear pore complex protein Nup133
VSNYSQLQIVAKSDSHIAETFGLPLPVQLNESLTFSDKNAAVSVNWSEQNGYAWAVCGRKLLVWQYKLQNSNSENSRTPQRRNIASQCRILTLPHSDIGHKASLITVFTPEGHTACLAVSPTGDVRFWPSIAHDGSSIDENGIMEGQEFDELVGADSQGYLLITTTCHLVALQIQVQNGRQTILHRIIKPPGGFFGGIGKRFASIIIGRQDDKESVSRKMLTYFLRKL